MFLITKDTLIIIIVLLALFLLYIVSIIAIICVVDKKYFSKRFDGKSYIKYQNYLSFKGLKKEDYSFISNNKKIYGEIYYYDNYKENKVIIFSLGLSGVIDKYINEIAYFASLGYRVYAYEYAGVGRSEGKKFIQAPQAIMDLENCIKKVRNLNPNAEIILAGHSVGAYASCNVLNLEFVDKVVAISPFNNMVDVVTDVVYDRSSKKIFMFSLIYKIILFFKFGKYARFNTFNTLKTIDTKVLVIHGTADKTVIVNRTIQSMMTNHNGFVKYILLQDKDHYPLLSSEAMTYNLFLEHQLEDLQLKYKKNIPEKEIELLNENINYNLINKFDEGILNTIKEFIEEV